MFPADKKRVESALSSAKLPKGKVRELLIKCKINNLIEHMFVIMFIKGIIN